MSIASEKGLNFMDLSRLLRRYYQYLKLEKGFSDNTVAAYMRDVDKFISFVNDENY